MDDLVRVMKALSDPGRITILKLLGQRELCACEIIGALRLAQPTISRHMKVLVDARLVTGRKVGPWVHYRVAENPASPYARTMLAELSGWLENDPAVLTLRAKLAASSVAASPGCANSRGCGPESPPAKPKEVRP